MSDKYGWMGTILRVDLSEGKITKEPLRDDIAHEFIGGRGLNLKILYDETGPETEPLGPDNRFIIGTGPLHGTLAPGNGRFTVTAKSPLTGILGDGNAGGHFAPELKYAGYDHIIVQGRAEKPVYLWIDNDKVTIKSAEHLWGKDTWETERTIRRELGDDEIKTLSIGQAGENLVRVACPIATGDHAPGRTGLGAVMGSKNLKAIAVRGSNSVKVADPEKCKQVAKKWHGMIYQHANFGWFSQIGTSCLVKQGNEANCRSFLGGREQQWPEERVGPIYGENFVPKYAYSDAACFSCPTHCMGYCAIKEGRYAGVYGKRPEGGGLDGLATIFGICNYPFAQLAVNLSNQYGMDTISLGGVIALAIELYERGIITKEDTDGLELEWYNEELIIELMHKIANRDGFGDILAEGPLKAAQKIGPGAEKYVEHVKGMGIHSSRRAQSHGFALAVCTSPRGMDHLRGLPRKRYWEMTDRETYDFSIVEDVVYDQYLSSACNLMEVCNFNNCAFIHLGKDAAEVMAEFLSAVTGIDFTEERLHQICNRVSNLERAYVCREGIRREDDMPPLRYSWQPITTGAEKGFRLDREEYGQMLDLFYERKGWDKRTGIPTRETLESSGLKSVADDLYKPR
ncbi:aldehyde ferredoxin oxidoreductase family protein [Candidatus Omnitrophota bacterium]